MQTFKVISLDMFQTLVNIQGGGQKSGSRFLSRNSAKISPGSWAASCSATISLYQPEAREAGSFISSKEIYSRGFQQVFLQYGLDYDCSQAVDNLFAQHRLSAMYADTEAFLQRICGSIRSALSVIPMSLCYLNSTGIIR